MSSSVLKQKWLWSNRLTYFSSRSAPEFGSLEAKNSSLRKTQSNPQHNKAVSPLAASATTPNILTKPSGKGDLKKQDRCHSVPGSLPSGETLVEEDCSKTSDPSSPVDTSSSKEASLERLKSSDGSLRKVPSPSPSATSSEASSPKPKKNTGLFEGFRNTLRKSKTDGGGSGGTGQKVSDVYATPVSMPDIVQDSGVRTCANGDAASGSASAAANSVAASTAAAQPPPMTTMTAAKQASTDSSEADQSPVSSRHR